MHINGSVVFEQLRVRKESRRQQRGGRKQMRTSWSVLAVLTSAFSCWKGKIKGWQCEAVFEYALWWVEVNLLGTHFFRKQLLVIGSFVNWDNLKVRARVCFSCLISVIYSGVGSFNGRQPPLFGLIYDTWGTDFGKDIRPTHLFVPGYLRHYLN